MKRRLLLAGSLLLAAREGAGGAGRLPLSKSLPDELHAAMRLGVPLVVMVSLDGCVHCALVRDHHLVPLLAQGRQPVVQVDIRSDAFLVDFAGQGRSHDQVVRAWGVKAAPTLLFLGPAGREVAPRLQGASIPDFYGAYLDERLRTARRELNR